MFVVFDNKLNKKVLFISKKAVINRNLRNELNKKVDFYIKYEYNIKYNIYGMVD